MKNTKISIMFDKEMNSMKIKRDIYELLDYELDFKQSKNIILEDILNNLKDYIKEYAQDICQTYKGE